MPKITKTQARKIIEIGIGFRLQQITWEVAMKEAQKIVDEICGPREPWYKKIIRKIERVF